MPFRILKTHLENVHFFPHPKPASTRFTSPRVRVVLFVLAVSRHFSFNQKKGSLSFEQLSRLLSVTLKCCGQKTLTMKLVLIQQIRDCCQCHYKSCSMTDSYHWTLAKKCTVSGQCSAANIASGPKPCASSKSLFVMFINCYELHITTTLIEMQYD